MDAVVPHTLHKGVHLGGTLHPRALALVRCLGFFCQPRIELVGDHAPGHAARAHYACGTAREDIDVADDRHIAVAKSLHRQPGLVELARIVTELGDDKLGASPQLFLQLVILAHELRFGGFEGAHHSAHAKVSGHELGHAAQARELEALVQLGDQPHELRGVQVEHGCRVPQVARRGIVTGQGQHIAHRSALQAIEQRLELVAALVLARKVDDDLDSQPRQFRTQHFGRGRRVTAGIIGNGQRVDPARPSGFLRRTHKFFLIALKGTATRHQLPGHGKGILVQQGLVISTRYF